MTKVLIALGSNIDPATNVPAALVRLQRHPELTVIAVSRVFESASVGRPDQPRFHNAAALIETRLEPKELRDELRRLEGLLGRLRTADKHHPRTIDLDIAAFEEFSGHLEGSIIPDPNIGVLGHLALPLADVAPDWPAPGGGTIAEAATAFHGPEQEIQVVSTEIARLNQGARYATEGRMEAVEDEVYDPAFEGHVRAMLTELGEDPTREGLVRTPLRVAKAMDFLTSGYTATLEDVVNNAIFEADTDEMVIVRDVEFYSLCEHHMLPFFGRAHVAYLPNDRIIGLSKIARIVDLFARRLQVQERLTDQIAKAVESVLDPHGVAVVMEGSHFCMMMRGVQKQGSSMVTSAMRGGFKDNARTRAEFMELIKT